MNTARVFFLLLAAVVVFLLWKIISPYLAVLLVAWVMAIVTSPFESRLRQWIGSARISSLITVALVFLVVFIPVVIASIVMVQQASQILQSSFGEAGWLTNLDVETHPAFLWLPQLVQQELVAIDFPALLKTVAAWLFAHLGEIFSSTARFFLNTFLFFLTLYYFLVDRERIRAEILELSPLRNRIDKKIMARITQTVRAVVYGSIIVAIVQGAVAAIGMAIFGVPGWLIWGAVAVIAAEVPLLGVGLVMVPAVIYLFLTGDTGNAIGLTIWAAVLVNGVDNLLRPMLIEGKTHMHALLILLSILGGLEAFGPIGLVIGPTVLAAFLVVVELYKSGILEK